MNTVQEANVINTQEAEIARLFKIQRSNVSALRVEPLSKRKERLAKLRSWIHMNRSRIHDAMFADLHKPSAEVDGIETFHVLNEIRQALNNLDPWAAPKKIDAPFTMLGTRSSVYYEPRGACLIIAPWNYPFNLAVGPLVSALAAGNAVIVKPSELTPNVSALLKKMAAEVFEENVVAVIEGDVDISKALLRLPFDHIFFTGSPTVGKAVMKAAAENLTSITLELGGKSPTIVTPSANIRDAAERIAVSKFVNNGQTCLAPDYVLVHEGVQERFLSALKAQITSRFFPEGQPEASLNYCRIVNGRHFERLNDLLQDALNAGAKLELTGKVDSATRFFHPMILSNVALHSRIMDEEIFGPILPILSYKNLDDAIALINAKPKALALYIYTSSGKEKKRLIRETSSGAVCINESAIHFLHHNLPFGGVNNSGFGKSHGHYGFLAFSHEKSVLRQKSGFTSVKAFYPPYTPASRKIMDWFLKLF